MRRAALLYLLRADALPRDHAVWRYLSVQTINFDRAAELAMRDLRDKPSDPCALLMNLALSFVAGGDGPLDDIWSQLSETASLDFRWPFYYAFRDRLYFSYELLPAWLPIVRRAVSDTVLHEFVRKALEEGDSEFQAVAEAATEADVAEFLAYARDLLNAE